MQQKDVWNFIFELGQLRRIKHEGWRIIGIDNLESVADHSLRAAQIGFILAKMEKYENPLEIVAILVFHDMGEARIGDIHKVANRYVQSDEERAVKDQTEKLGDIGKDIFALWRHGGTKADIIAKDADLLEQAAIAKEHIEKGHKFAQNWINNISKKLQTGSAKKLLSALEKTSFNDWWHGLKKID
ncbi:MAG: HD domain-containing protein [Candidatus Aenigmarchaeota archaeon]|nr:HD domain-containing protein [Candidatus Aenigmarchaeota archaeon]